MGPEEFILKYIKENEKKNVPTKTSHLIVDAGKKEITERHVKEALRDLHHKGVIYDPNEGTNLKGKYVRMKAR